MTQTLDIAVEMTADSFHKFAVFDFLHHKKAWHRPLLFAAILLVSAGICLSQTGRREGAALLAIVLAVVAVGLPAAWFWNFFHNLKTQIRKMGLPRPFYRLELGDAGLSIWMAGEQDKAAPSRHCAWQDLHLAYRTQDAIYLYVQKNQAYLVHSNLDAAWELLEKKLAPEQQKDCRKSH